MTPHEISDKIFGLIDENNDGKSLLIQLCLFFHKLNAKACYT